MKLLSSILLIVLMLSPSLLGQVATPRLKVGSLAPPLSGTHWLKGEPVRSFEPGKIYVVEMWATWCSPCVAAMPHLSRLQREYEKDGLIVIGQSIWENDIDAVAPFVNRMGDQMGYRVVLDDLTGGGRGRMAQSWMDAADQSGIPCSFVIGRDGRIAWIGHPMAIEPVIKQMVAGTFDPQKALADQRAMEQLSRDLETAMVSRQWDRALRLLSEFSAKQSPGALQDRVDAVRFNILLQKREYDLAYALAGDLAVRFNDDANMLNEMSWTIVDEPGLEKRDLDVAEKMAERAVELTRRTDPSILDTLARVHFEKGRIDLAIELQTEAVERAPADMKGMLQRTLERYREARTSP